MNLVTYPCRWLFAAVWGVGLLLAAPGSAQAAQGADIALRLLEGVLGAARQSANSDTGGGAVAPAAPASPEAREAWRRLQPAPLYTSKEQWLNDLRQNPPRPESLYQRDYRRLAASVWLIINSPQRVSGWPLNNVDVVSFEERVARNLRNLDDSLARTLTNQPPDFLQTRDRDLRAVLSEALAQLGNPAEMAGCRVDGISCSQKLVGFVEEYVAASVEGLEAERRRRVAAWRQQEAARAEVLARQEAAAQAQAKERQAEEDRQLRVRAEQIRAEEERRARQRANRVGG